MFTCEGRNFGCDLRIGRPDRGAPCGDRTISRPTRWSGEDIGRRHRPAMLGKRDGRPAARAPREHHVGALYLPAGESALDVQVKADQRECHGDRFRRLRRVLRREGIDDVLVDERGVTVCEGVGR